MTINPLMYESEMTMRFTRGNDDNMAFMASTFNPSKVVGKGSDLGLTVVKLVRVGEEWPYRSGDSIVLDADTHFPVNEYFDRMKVNHKRR